MRNKLFRFLLLLTALVVASVAAYFSVFGISKLFAGALVAAIVMSSSLEIGKLVLSSYLYRTWSSISKIRRIYGVLAVGVLMLITSVGIYGFLSSAFEKTSIKVEHQDSQLEIIDTRIKSKENERERYEQLILDKQTRIVTLSDLRKSQEVRLDSLLVNEHWTNATRTTKSIESADTEIGKLYGEIDELSVKLDSSNNQIVNLKTDKLQFKGNTDVAGEVGPLRYISRLTGSTMDKVVNWVILLLIFVFDPLAIYLLLSYNHLLLSDTKVEMENNVTDIYQTNTDNTSMPLPKIDTTKPESITKNISPPVDSDTRQKLLDKYSKLKKKELTEVEHSNITNEDDVEELKKTTNHRRVGTMMDPATGGIVNRYD